jgi:hypothetical protein
MISYTFLSGNYGTFVIKSNTTELIWDIMLLELIREYIFVII